jgi:exopolyphosphatase/guanosine-5'-triphosphate,3'-diphosphate pyrophosphatase
VPRYAAIDIGSNSIRMEAAEVISGQPTRILVSDREVTRLGDSVFRTGFVSEEALQSTCRVLARMAEQYRRLDVAGVRAVATSAIRDTRNQAAFLERASEAAGTPVEIISGREEARLIHLGVQSDWPQKEKRVLLLDIGGGSAEVIASYGGHLTEIFSKPLGAVRLNANFLNSDPPDAVQLLQMREFINEKMDDVVRRLGRDGWDRVIATSATAAAAASAVARVPRSKRDQIDRLRVPATEIRRLYANLSVKNLAARRKATGIGPRRAEIIVPGLAVLLRFLEEFRVRAFYYSKAGVRDGIIADLAARNVGAELARLTRDQRREVEDMGRRYHVPLDRARRVGNIAQQLFSALQPLHNLPPGYGRLLEAAAYLLDVGHIVSSASHHKHSWYLVSNSDLAGFTDRERLLIAALCRYHRKSLPSPLHSAYQLLSSEEKQILMRLVPLLRLADNLEPGRGDGIQRVECRLRDDGVQLKVHGDGDIDLAQWGAERAGEVFRDVYNRSISVTRAPR